MRSFQKVILRSVIFEVRKKINRVNFEVTSEPKDQFSPDAKQCVQFRGLANYIVRQREKRINLKATRTQGLLLNDVIAW